MALFKIRMFDMKGCQPMIKYLLYFSTTPQTRGLP